MDYQMTYELFVELIIQNITDYLPEKLQGTEVVCQEVQKINEKRIGIAFVDPNEKGTRLSPNVYLEEFYHNYQEGWSMKEILENLGEELHKAVRGMDGLAEKIQPDNIRENVFYKLIHTGQNQELLRTMPHRAFHDLSIVYGWYIGKQADALLTAPINSALAASSGLSEEELYQLAKENTKRLFPTTIQPMSEVIEELYGNREKPQEEIFELLPDGEFPMYVMSNSMRHFGAAAILYEDGMQRLADSLDDNLYLIPSSIHEWIVVPENFVSLEQVSEIVREVNFSTVELEERLSNEVYHYDKRTRQFTIATDVQNKSLSDHVAEEKTVYQADPPRR